MGKYMFKVNKNNTRTTDVILVFILLTWNKHLSEHTKNNEVSS